MRRNTLIVKLLMLAALLAFCAPITFADTPGRHPGYLHALSDLRYARALLKMDYADDWPAVQEVDNAIRAAKDGALDDGKPLGDHPRIDANMDRRGRLQKAVSLLDSALTDLAQPEDNASAIPFRDRAKHHVQEARRLVWAEMQGR